MMLRFKKHTVSNICMSGMDNGILYFWAALPKPFVRP